MSGRRRAPVRRGLPPIVPLCLGMATLGLSLLVYQTGAGLGEYKLVLVLSVGGIGLGLLALAAVQSFAWKDSGK